MTQTHLHNNELGTGKPEDCVCVPDSVCGFPVMTGQKVCCEMYNIQKITVYILTFTSDY